MTISSLTIADATKLLELGIVYDLEAIQAAFRTKAKAVHPDMVGGSDEALCQLVDARDLLLEDLRRETLNIDRLMGCAQEPELLIISLDQAIHGGDIDPVSGVQDKAIPDEPRAKPIATRNSLKIKLPKGLRNEDQLRIKAHDLDLPDHLFRIRIDGDDGARAWGDDIWMTAYIDLKLFYYGGCTDIETPRGLQKIDLRPDTARGASLTIKGMGLPKTLTRQAGDLIIRLEARVRPAKPAQELLSAFQKAWA